MSLQILDIVIYSHDGRLRRLKLEPGKVSIITGASKSGKSALVHIVDYCFGSGECPVPEGPIRRSVSWFGLRLQLESGQAFIARRCPERRAVSNEDCFVDIGSTVDIPEAAQLKQTTNTKGLIGLLSAWCGIKDNVHEPLPGQTRAPLSATVRHALCLCFQPQDEIIRRQQLFHGASDSWISQALKDTLPYFLGAVDDEYVRKREELRRLKDELRGCDRRLGELRALRGDGLSKASILLAQARDTGLTASSASSWEQTVSVLREVGATPMASLEAGLEGQTAGSEFEKLATARIQLRSEQRRLQDEVTAIRSFAKDEKGFATEAKEQQARLQSIGIFDGVDPGHSCPMCAQPLPAAATPPTNDDLKHSLSTLATRLNSVIQAAPQIEKVASDTERRLQEVRGALTKNWAEMEGVRSANERLSRVRDDSVKQAHILGRIALYLDSLPGLPDTKALEERAAFLRTQCDVIESELSDEHIQDRVDSITSILGQNLTAWSKRLELEHSKYPLRLDVKKLTVVADTADGPVPMSRMGSGENWVGYHLIAHLALHQWFAGQKRPVPNFLFLDQPSQAYFPAETDADPSLTLGSEDDRQAVSRMLKLVFDVVAGASSLESSGMQVIITEHADINEAWFKDAVAERWRHGKKLVPDDWPRDLEAN